jgi:zinc transporter 1/2/3
MTTFFLLLALSIHAFFEGIALGLLNTNREIFYMVLAIAFHKWVESLSIGINLSKSKIEKDILLTLLVIFSLTTPMGILIGILLNSIGSIVEAIFISFSAGTFLYISASEVIVEEFALSRNKISKFLGFILGFSLIALITLFEFSH